MSSIGVLRSPILLGASGVPASVTGTASETQLASIAIPAGVMGVAGGLRIGVIFSFTNSGNNKTARVRFGGSGGAAYLSSTVTTTEIGRYQTEVWNDGAANSQKGWPSSTSFGLLGISIGSGAVDTSAATTVYISGQLANTGETITLLRYSVELLQAVS